MKHGSRFKDLSGLKFGSLTVVSLSHIKGNKALWHCRCDCGGSRITKTYALRTGLTTSCGCGRRKPHRNTRTYSSWANMIARCTQPISPAYPHYKCRGITVCERWRSFDNFYTDMGERPEGNYTLDRIDNSGNYEPGNVRWATKREQAENRITNVFYEYKGGRYTISQLVRMTGVSLDILRSRLTRTKKKWTVEDAVNTPVIPRHMRRTSGS